ncbi:MAG: hypothetical protein AB1426_09680 [Bacillota bacterium]
MKPLAWAKKRKSARITAQSFWARVRGNPEPRTTSRLDKNELGKLIATLRRQDLARLRQIAAALAAEEDQNPVSAFGRRSNNEYLGRFKVLLNHVIETIPPEWQDKDAIRGLEWLRRLLEIEEADRRGQRQGNDSLISWLFS